MPSHIEPQERGVSLNAGIRPLLESTLSIMNDESEVPVLTFHDTCPACTQDEVNTVFASAKVAQKAWAKTPLWKRAELLHKAAAMLKEHKTPIAAALVKEIAKPAKDAVTEVRTTRPGCKLRACLLALIGAHLKGTFHT